MSTRINQAEWYEKYNRWQIKVQADGKRKTFTSSIPGMKGKRECHAKADDWLEKRLVGEHTRVDVLFDSWIDELKITTSRGNWSPYISIGDTWVKPGFGAKKIGKVVEQDLRSVITSAHKAGKSKKYLMNIRSCMTAFIKYCRGCGCTQLYPEQLTIPRNAPSKEKSVVQPNDLKTLFTSTKTLFNRQVIDDWNIYAYRFMVVTGLRPGEIIGLERNSIRDNKIFIKGAINQYGEHTTGKNDNAIRSFTLPIIAINIWNEQQAALRRAGLVSRYAFPSSDGLPLTEKKLRKRWSAYREHNGISKTTPYELRHTFVSVNADMPDALKKMLVGHSKSMDTDGVYSHELDGDQLRAATMIDEAFNRILDPT